VESTKGLTGHDGVSDELKRSLESIDSAARMTALAGLGHSDELKRSLESMDSAARMTALAGLGRGDELKRPLESMNSAARMTGLAGLGHSDELKRSFESINSAAKMAGLAGLGINDELKRSLEHTSLLARDVDDALSNIRIPARTYDMLGQSIEAPTLEPPPNPIWETNRQLAELTDTVTQLVDVARQQAELSQAIRNASDLALQTAIQSGDEARAATQLARKSVRLTFGAIIVAIIIAILNVSVAVYEKHRESATADDRRQEEIRVLREISGQLKGLKGQVPGSEALR
jgi:hypothetical protein